MESYCRSHPLPPSWRRSKRILRTTVVIIVCVTVCVIAAAVAWFLLRPAKVPDLMLSDSAVAELATREVKWQVVVSGRNLVPARRFVVSRIAVVKAGFDLGELRPEDVAADPKTRKLVVKLPHPKVLSVSWGEPQTLQDEHSLVAAMSTKPSEEERKRQAMFESALIDDVARQDLLSFDKLRVGIETHLGKIAKANGWTLELVPSDGGTSSRRAMEDYFGSFSGR
ncbi:MAG: DUF4230 domain-containing protein [Victivallaceae bacterium]|nr:DUF4230 domain-containing protein [Victivallaceae bacterium]